MRRVVMVVCTVLVIVPVMMKSRTSRDIPARTAFHVVSSGRMSVKVSGEVLHSGIYNVSANTMAVDVIKMAAPLRPLKQYRIDPSATRPLQNGSCIRLLDQHNGTFLLTSDQITVPERLVLGIPLDISLMKEADFDRLPGIGPALAKRIIVYRQNNGDVLRVSDLTAVEGIGDKRYRALRSYFQVP